MSLSRYTLCRCDLRAISHILTSFYKTSLSLAMACEISAAFLAFYLRVTPRVTWSDLEGKNFQVFREMLRVGAERFDSSNNNKFYSQLYSRGKNDFAEISKNLAYCCRSENNSVESHENN